MPSSTLYTAAQYAALAAKQVGKRYVLGQPIPYKGGNPKAHDCSGLVIWLNNESGALPQGDTTAAGLYNRTTAVKAGAEKVGDLVFLRNNPARSNGIGHVAVLTSKLSNGDWRIVEAKGKAYGVVNTTLSYWRTRKHFTGVRRLTGFKLTPATPSAATLRGRILAALSKGQSYTADAKALAQVDGWRGERFAWMAGHIVAWNRGVALTLDARKLTVPGKGHAFVVLGAGTAEMTRRLTAGLPAILANPASKVIVTGAPLRGGVTEAEWMRRWLIAKGVPSGRILVEPKATSTIGNALHSVALMQAKGLTTYTLISAASHLRRAQIHFLAARVKTEMATGKKTGLATAGLIAYDDYSTRKPPEPIKPLGPVDATSRTTITAEVASLLGLTSQYKAAL